MNSHYLDKLSKLDWQTPWNAANSDFASQLRKEVGPGHLLYGQLAISIAHRVDNDDVLFYLPDYEAPLAVVHLTWADKPGNDPAFPWTVFYASIEEWIERCMKASS